MEVAQYGVKRTPKFGCDLAEQKALGAAVFWFAMVGGLSLNH